MNKILFSFTLLLFTITAQANTISRVIDGDTVIYGNNTKGRLAYIDAPELKQEFGEKSRNALIKYLNENSVSIIELNNDIYDRKLIIITNTKTKEVVNSLLVKYGYAWDYSRKYITEQTFAQNNKHGLWASNTAPMNPRLFRDMYRYPGLFIEDTSNPACKSRGIKYCSDFKTCEEALFWFNTCGHYYLDRDINNIPCQTICK